MKAHAKKHPARTHGRSGPSRASMEDDGRLRPVRPHREAEFVPNDPNRIDPTAPDDPELEPYAGDEWDIPQRAKRRYS